MAQTTLNTRICFRRDTTSAWEASNPVLLAGEPAIATDENGNVYLKIGNGQDVWKDLPTFNCEKIKKQRQYKTLNPQHEIL